MKKLRNLTPTIIGAVVGDVLGSVYEFNNVRSEDFVLLNPLADYTDDTVLTMAVADAVLNNKDFASTIWEYGNNYPHRGYSSMFRMWLKGTEKKPYNSYGNGSAMRVSAVGFAYNTLEEVLLKAKESAEVTHNHPEGIKGAQAVVAAIYLSRSSKSKKEIKEFITNTFGYNLDFTLEEIKPTYRFNETCQDSVPQAIVAFLESKDFRDCIWRTIWLGGDSDTLACISGSIAAAYYRTIDDEILDFVEERLPYEFIELIENFNKKFNY